MKTLILDNYDSFTFNLYQYVGELESPPRVCRNDRVSLREIEDYGPDRIIISPGPGSPCDPRYFGVCLDTIRVLGKHTPILGVCLGHQGIIHAFGGRVVRAPKPMHGKTSFVFHNDESVFRGLPRAFEAMRYHSLVGAADSIPDCLAVTARTWEGVIMGVQHRELPIYGVQFHPESIGTSLGHEILTNFLRRGEALVGGGGLDEPGDASPLVAAAS
jgi:anthranilate synthase component II